MKITIHNPKIATLNILYDMEYQGYSDAQAINQIEKALKAQSIVCDKITVKRTKKGKKK